MQRMSHVVRNLLLCAAALVLQHAVSGVEGSALSGDFADIGEGPLLQALLNLREDFSNGNSIWGIPQALEDVATSEATSVLLQPQHKHTCAAQPQPRQEGCFGGNEAFRQFVPDFSDSFNETLSLQLFDEVFRVSNTAASDAPSDRSLSVVFSSFTDWLVRGLTETQAGSESCVFCAQNSRNALLASLYGHDEARTRQLRAYTQGRMWESSGQLPALWKDVPEIEMWTGPTVQHPATASTPGGRLTTFSNLTALEKAAVDGYFALGNPTLNEDALLLVWSTAFVRLHNLIASGLAQVTTLGDEQLFKRSKLLVQTIVLKLFATEAANFALGLVDDKGVMFRPELRPVATELGLVPIFVELKALLTWTKRVPFNVGAYNASHRAYNPLLLSAVGLPSLYAAMRETVVRAPGAHTMTESQRYAAFDFMRDQAGQGMASFNAYRSLYKLKPYSSFEDFGVDGATADALRGIFSSVDKVDLWTGLHVEASGGRGSAAAETAQEMLAVQLLALSHSISSELLAVSQPTALSRCLVDHLSVRTLIDRFVLGKNLTQVRDGGLSVSNTDQQLAIVNSAAPPASAWCMLPPQTAAEWPGTDANVHPFFAVVQGQAPPAGSSFVSMSLEDFSGFDFYNAEDYLGYNSLLKAYAYDSPPLWWFVWRSFPVIVFTLLASMALVALVLEETHTNPANLQGEKGVIRQASKLAELPVMKRFTFRNAINPLRTRSALDLFASRPAPAPRSSVARSSTFSTGSLSQNARSVPMDVLHEATPSENKEQNASGVARASALGHLATEESTSRTQLNAAVAEETVVKSATSERSFANLVPSEESILESSMPSASKDQHPKHNNGERISSKEERHRKKEQELVSVELLITNLYFQMFLFFAIMSFPGAIWSFRVLFGNRLDEDLQHDLSWITVLVFVRGLLYMVELALRMVYRPSPLLALHHLGYFVACSVAYYSVDILAAKLAVALDMFTSFEFPLYLSLFLAKVGAPPLWTRTAIAGGMILYCITRILQSAVCILLLLLAYPRLGGTSFYGGAWFLFVFFTAVQCYTFVFYSRFYKGLKEAARQGQDKADKKVKIRLTVSKKK